MFVSVYVIEFQAIQGQTVTTTHGVTRKRRERSKEYKEKNKMKKEEIVNLFKESPKKNGVP